MANSALSFDGDGDGDGGGGGRESSLSFFAVQSAELHLDSIAVADLELAFRLQLDEALAASLAMAVGVPPPDFPLKKEAFPPADHMLVSAMGAGDCPSSLAVKEGFPPGVLLPSSMADGGPPPVPPPSSYLVVEEDRSLAISLQSLELSRLQQEAADRSCATFDAERNRATLLQVSHDAELARRISNTPDCEWDEHGDLLENPFESSLESTDSPHHSPPVQLYFTSIHLEENTNTPSSSPSPITSFMGMVILDHTGSSLIEMKKPLCGSSGKAESNYLALIFALEWTLSAGFQFIQAYTDSVIVFNQVKGRWKVNSKKKLSLWSQVMMYIHKFQGFELLLLSKNENQHATRLARDTINSELLAASKNAPPSSHDNIRNVNEVVLEDCTICFEEITESEMVTVTPCSHRFCMSCVVQHMEVKVQAGQVPVQCPHLDCKCSFPLEQCKATLSQKWFDLLMRMLTEASIPEQERVYCPFPQCSALMLKKDLERTLQACSSSSSSFLNSYAYNRVTCVKCHRPFCHYCRVSWHKGISCEEYQKSPLNGQNAQDVYLYGLARDKKWQRCEKCRRMIELAEGCYHITCRCGHEFCYLCGAEWVDKKQTCKCRLWDDRNIIREPLDIIPGFVLNIEDDTDSNDGFDLSDSDFSDDDDDSDDDSEHQAFDREQATANPFYKTKLCWYHARGYCWAGRNCKFAHGEHDLR